MDAKLTYISFLFIIACLVSSCTSDEPGEMAPDKKAELTFTVAGLSRASVTTDLNIPGSKFVVYGDMKLPESDLEDPIVIFDKTEVEYINNSWCYNDMQYWIPDLEHSFVAVHPVSAVRPENEPSYTGSRLSFSYTIPSSENAIDKNDVCDIIGATHRRVPQQGDGIPVSFRFSHLLSLINFSPALSVNTMGPEGYMLLREIELTGLKNKANFSILPATLLSNTLTDDRVIEVTDQEGDMKMTIAFDEPVKIMNNAESTSLFDSDDAIIMIPQSFPVLSPAKITLTYTLNDEQEPRVMSAPLGLLEWESGKSYSYRFIIDLTSLRFDNCEIKPWNAMPADEISVD